MSVVSVGIKPSTLEASEDRNGVRKYNFTARIITNALMGPRAVLNDPLTPALFSPYGPSELGESDSSAKCISRKIKQDSDGELTWELDLEFSSDSEAQGKEENPLDELPRYSLQWETRDKVIEQDLDGEPIVNTVGDLFTDPPYTEEEDLPVMVVTRNEASLPVALAMDYKNKVNSDEFYGAEPGKVKLKAITTGELQVQNDVEFYKVTYEFVFNPDGWQPEILNRGHRAKNADGKIIDLPNKEVRNLKEDGTLPPNQKLDN